MNEMTRLRTNVRGTASVEIVVMLPVFITLFLATFYLHDLGMAAQRAGVASRSCIWAHAVAGCPDRRPAACDDLVLSDAQVGDPEDSEGAQDGSEDVEPNPSKSAFDRLADLPVVGAAIQALFGKGVRITATRSARAFMRSEYVSLSRSNYVVCNTVPATWSEKLDDLKNAVVGWGD